MGHDTVLLSDSQVNQLIVSIYLNGVQAVLELGIEAFAETVPLLNISVSIITCLLI
jgi:hypothetical protein